MDTKDQEIKRLKKLVKKLRMENEELKSPLQSYVIIEQALGTYSPLLHPHFQEFKTVNLKSKSCTFNIVVTDIICIKSARDTKWIYFSKKQVSFAGERYESDKLQFTGRIEDFINIHNGARIYLCIVSKSVAVNPCYYRLNSKRLELLGNTGPHEECNNIAVGPKFLKNFIEQKESLDNMKDAFEKMKDFLAK